jgi:hypothetical protein
MFMGWVPPQRCAAGRNATGQRLRITPTGGSRQFSLQKDAFFSISALKLPRLQHVAG